MAYQPQFKDDDPEDPFDALPYDADEYEYEPSEIDLYDWLRLKGEV